MNNIIKFEMRKLFSSKALYICMGIIMVIVIATTYLFGSGQDEVGNNQITTIYVLVTSISGVSLDLILAILISLLTCEDFTNGTIKTIVGRGYSRKKIYISKYIMTVVCTITLSVACWVAALISGKILLNDGKGWGINLILILGAQLLIIIVISTASFAFSMIIRKKAGAIAVGVLMPSIVTIILSIIDNLFKKVSFKISDYWIYNFFTKVSDVEVKNTVIVKSMWISIIYIIIFGSIGYLCYRKSEV